MQQFMSIIGWWCTHEGCLTSNFSWVLLTVPMLSLFEFRCGALLIDLSTTPSWAPLPALCAVSFCEGCFLSITKCLQLVVVFSYCHTCINWKFIELLLCLNWVEILFLHNGCVVAILITA